MISCFYIKFIKNKKIMRLIIIFLIPILLFILLFGPHKKVIIEDSSNEETRFSGFLEKQEVKGKILANQVPKSPIEVLFKDIIKILPDYRWYNLFFKNNSCYMVGEEDIKGESPYLVIRLSPSLEKEYTVETGKSIKISYDSERELNYFISFGDVFPSREYLEKVSTRTEEGNVKIATKVEYRVYVRPTLFATIIRFIIFLFAYWAIILIILRIINYYKSGIQS